LDIAYPLGSDDYCSEVLHGLSGKICEDLPMLEHLDDSLTYLLVHLVCFRVCLRLIPQLSYALQAPSTTIALPCADAFDMEILDSLLQYT